MLPSSTVGFSRLSVMACRGGLVIFQSSLLVMENENSRKVCVLLASRHIVKNKKNRQGLCDETSKFGIKSSPFPIKSSSKGKNGSEIAFALDTSGIPNNADGDADVDADAQSQGLEGGTRLGRIASAGGRQLLEKLNAARKNFPMKIFLVLLGFYTANALATILGQSGDWDIIVAGLVVAAIEGIGRLMYRRKTKTSNTLTTTTRRYQSLVVMLNYWKAGVCLGLFVDAFKVGS
ncbi:hypothetical protein NMG60_11036334 [Bertholletia excelsa]